MEFVDKSFNYCHRADFTKPLSQPVSYYKSKRDSVRLVRVFTTNFNMEHL